MFTMKKFATLAMTGFLACSILACGEDPEECEEGDETCEQPSSSSGGNQGSGPWTLSDLTGTGWTTKASVKVGGTTASLGSFLDIDGTIDASGSGASAVWKIGEAPAHANDIDLVYDGTNIFSITGCKASCPANYKTAISTSTNNQAFHALPSNIGPGTSACSIHSAVPGTGSTVINNYVVAERSTYYIATSEGSRAIILVGAKDATAGTVELHIGYLYSPSGCN